MFRWKLMVAFLGGLGALTGLLVLGVLEGWWTTQIGPGDGAEAALYLAIFAGMIAFIVAAKLGTFGSGPPDSAVGDDAPAAAPGTCWRCGRPVPEDADACPFCGASLD